MAIKTGTQSWLDQLNKASSQQAVITGQQVAPAQMQAVYDSYLTGMTAEAKARAQTAEQKKEHEEALALQREQLTNQKKQFEQQLAFQQRIAAQQQKAAKDQQKQQALKSLSNIAASDLLGGGKMAKSLYQGIKDLYGGLKGLISPEEEANALPSINSYKTFGGSGVDNISSSTGENLATSQGEYGVGLSDLSSFNITAPETGTVSGIGSPYNAQTPFFLGPTESEIGNTGESYLGTTMPNIVPYTGWEPSFPDDGGSFSYDGSSSYDNYNPEPVDYGPQHTPSTQYFNSSDYYDESDLGYDYDLHEYNDYYEYVYGGDWGEGGYYW
jgi:hypothetical protein